MRTRLSSILSGLVFIFYGLIFCVLSAPNAAFAISEVVLFSDDFEDYTPGTFPSEGGWEIVYNGRGNAYQVVVDSISYSGTKSLQLWGKPYWTAAIQHAFNSNADKLGFELAILIDDIGTGGPVRYEDPGFWNKDVGPWGTNCGAVVFNHDDQKIHARDGTELGTWEPDTWYTVRVLFDRSIDRYSIWINGELKGDFARLSTELDPQLINGLLIVSQHPGVKVYYDSIKVFEVEGYSLTVDVQPPGSGIVSLNPTQPAGGYDSGTVVTLTANPALGYEFDYWSGDLTGTETTKTLLMDANKTVTANFKAVVDLAHWPMFRHDFQHTGRSPYAGPETPTLKWSFATGDDFNEVSPAIGPDGTIYVGTEDNNLYAVNPNGTEKWRFAAGSGIYSSPAIGPDGTIYVGSYYNLYAVNPDGTLKWSFATGSYVDSSPAIDSNGTIYVGSYDHNLYAVNPDGSLKWSFATGYHVRSSPAIGSDGTIYVGSQDNNLYAIGPLSPPLADALDNTALTWTTGGDSDWFGQTETYYYDGDAAQSGDIGHNQSTSLSATTVTGPGILSFSWKVSSQARYDLLRFYIDGVEQDRTSGFVGWQQESYSIGPGTHTIEWRYTKNGSVDRGSDCGWVDNVRID